ncbi:MAG: helical backbone metal receptor [Synergistaceae bacterium]|jgi:iron complex transport system substrate-binding protein|nr:helical backbone metal receptor [Synergistaceae bacterium]
MMPAFICLMIAAVLPSAASGAPRRILSLAPAATEILFDLGLGEYVVGVTEYCKWPPEAASKTNIGDMMRVNMETVVSLAPDLVVISNMNGNLRDKLEALGLRVVTVYQDDFDQICESMLRVGKACGVEERAVDRVASLRRAVEDISERGAGDRSDSAKKPRALVVIARDAGDTEFRRLHVAGPKSFYDDLLERSGARNAFTDEVAYASITREGLMRIDPDIVIELVAEYGMSSVGTGELLAQWDAFGDLPAAENGRTAVIRGDFTFRAGPRYPEILTAFSMVIQGGVRSLAEGGFQWQ